MFVVFVSPVPVTSALMTSATPICSTCTPLVQPYKPNSPTKAWDVPALPRWVPAPSKILHRPWSRTSAARFDIQMQLPEQTKPADERVKAKQKLLAEIASTDRGALADTDQRTKIAQLVREMGNLNPNPAVFDVNPKLVDGPWKMLYADAPEINRLFKLPVKIGEIRQTIDLATGTFKNVVGIRADPFLQAETEVKATLEVIGPETIRAHFLTRDTFVTQLLGAALPQKFAANLVVTDNYGTLTLTYIDENMRIGFGGNNSLYVLERVS